VLVLAATHTAPHRGCIDGEQLHSGVTVGVVEVGEPYGFDLARIVAGQIRMLPTQERQVLNRRALAGSIRASRIRGPRRRGRGRCAATAAADASAGPCTSGSRCGRWVTVALWHRRQRTARAANQRTGRSD